MSGNPARRLEEIHFVPQPALAEHVAVIGEQQHDGIVGEARIGECAEQHADLIVDVGDRAIVGAARGAHLRLGHGLQIQTADVAQAARMRVELLGAHPHARHVDVDALIAVPVARAG